MKKKKEEDGGRKKKVVAMKIDGWDQIGSGGWTEREIGNDGVCV